MKKIPLEIIIPVYNEGKKIVELLAKRKVLVENPFYRGPGLGFKIGEGFN